MKKTLLVLALTLIGYCSFAQTNTFPSSGNVGIGTTTPTSKLYIESGSYFDGQGTPGNPVITPVITIHGTDAGAGGHATATIGWTPDRYIGGSIGVMAFKVEDPDAGGSASYLFMNPDSSSNVWIEEGNVTLGKNRAYGYKLAVNGSAIATSMTVKLQANWPDYVFKTNYHLPNLAEVKAYIDQNQHLPEMPSAQEIAKDGLNLGEINKLLTKKVEELTLYLIDQSKHITEQDKQLSEQQKQLTALAEQIGRLNKTPLQK